MELCKKEFAKESEECLLFPSRRSAKECKEFIINRSSDQHIIPFCRIVESTLWIEKSLLSSNQLSVTIFLLIFPEKVQKLAKEFWQHTGEGISSRLAQHCVYLIKKRNQENLIGPKCGNQRYSKINPSLSSLSIDFKHDKDSEQFVEERFGRNFPVECVGDVKKIIQRRICHALNGHQDITQNIHGTISKQNKYPPLNVCENDVFLYPCGMNAIYNIYRIILKMFPGLKSVQFG